MRESLREIKFIMCHLLELMRENNAEYREEDQPVNRKCRPAKVISFPRRLVGSAAIWISHDAIISAATVLLGEWGVWGVRH